MGGAAVPGAGVQRLHWLKGEGPGSGLVGFLRCSRTGPGARKRSRAPSLRRSACDKERADRDRETERQREMDNDIDASQVATARDPWPSAALGDKWQGGEGHPCAGLKRGQLPPLLQTHAVAAGGRMGRMGPRQGDVGGGEDVGSAPDDEPDARLLQQRGALFEPLCELCGKPGSLPLQGPLSGPFAERPLRLPPEGTARDQALLRAPGWAHTWCVHYACAERPAGTLAGDTPTAGGLERDTVRAVNAIRRGRRETCGVCWQPGATGVFFCVCVCVCVCVFVCLCVCVSVSL